ncbi:MAG: serine/threonine-protein kinase, partial [Planctomycetota bacterium]
MSISINLAIELEPLFQEFEQQLRLRQSPSIAEFANRVEENLRDELLQELFRLKWEYAGIPDSADADFSDFPKYRESLETCLEESKRISPQLFQPGDCIGSYRVVGELGAGRFGRVYKAWDERLDRAVALKSPTAKDTSGKIAARILAEAKSLAELSHPNIVKIHDVIEDENGWPLLVLELIDGEPLDVGADLGINLELFTNLCDAVAYIHRKGYIHRDLKPDNVIVDQQNRVTVADFGLSMKTEERQRQQSISAGTIRYMSPEMVRGESQWVDGRTDIWSLGVILYEMIAGRSPFPQQDEEQIVDGILNGSVVPPRQFNADCPEAIEQACLKCLEKDAQDRFSTASDLANAIRIDTVEKQAGLESAAFIQEQLSVPERIGPPPIVAAFAATTLLVVFFASVSFYLSSAGHATKGDERIVSASEKDLARPEKSGEPAGASAPDSERKDGAESEEKLPGTPQDDRVRMLFDCEVERNGVLFECVEALPLLHADILNFRLGFTESIYTRVIWIHSDAEVNPPGLHELELFS